MQYLLLANWQLIILFKKLGLFTILIGHICTFAKQFLLWQMFHNSSWLPVLMPPFPVILLVLKDSTLSSSLHSVKWPGDLKNKQTKTTYTGLRISAYRHNTYVNIHLLSCVCAHVHACLIIHLWIVWSSQHVVHGNWELRLEHTQPGNRSFKSSPTIYCASYHC